MSHTVTRVGAQRMRDLADHIELHDRFDYSIWVGGVAESLLGIYETAEVLDECQTPGCIAGWAVNLATIRGESVEYEPYEIRQVDYTARVWLELSVDAMWSLFYGKAMFDAGIHEPDPDLSEYLNGYELRRRATAVDAAKVLRMIADGEVPGWVIEEHVS